MSRRTFVGGAAAALAGMGATAAVADEIAASNRVCKALGIEKPVIQASMAYLTDANLVAAVSEAGGLGVLGEYPGGYADAPADDAEYMERLAGEIRKVKELTDKPFAVQHSTYEGFMDTIAAEGVQTVFLTGFGPSKDHAANTDAIAELKEAGYTVIYRDINPTLESLLDADAAGADVIVATGYGSGGHAPETRRTLAGLLQQAAGKLTAPIVAAGEIVNGVGARAAAALGAEGVYVGTRFNACEESPCCEAAKQAIVEARAEDLVEFRGIIGFVRTTDTPLARQCVELSDAGAERIEISGLYGGCFQKTMLLGEDFDEGLVVVDGAVDAIDSVKPAAQIVDELAGAFGL